MDKLFVYGTLGPGRPNEHVLTNIGGSFKTASIKGRLREAGWGADRGYPGIDLDENGDEVKGFIFCSDNLDNHWKALDDFEGEGYQRLPTKATLEDGSVVDVYVYSLRS